MATNKKKHDLKIETPADAQPEAQPAEEAAAEPEQTGLEAQLKEAEAKRDEYFDALLRERASFENYKRRNETAVSKAMTDAKNSAAAGFFPVLDNLERALAAVTEESPLKEGVDMIYKQLVTVLADMGITEIEAAGQPFDPNLHNAVLQVDPEEGEESGIVKTVLQKGYRTKDQVLRHTMVMVTK